MAALKAPPHDLARGPLIVGARARDDIIART